MSVSPFLKSAATSFLYEYIVDMNIFSVTAALPPAKKEGQRLSCCVYPQRDGERDGCEEDGLTRKVWGGGGRAEGSLCLWG